MHSEMMPSRSPRRPRRADAETTASASADDDAAADDAQPENDAEPSTDETIELLPDMETAPGGQQHGSSPAAAPTPTSATLSNRSRPSVLAATAVALLIGAALVGFSDSSMRAYYASNGGNATSDPVQQQTLESSAFDDRAYSWSQLPNGLRVVLVHDPDAVVATAALDVHVGSLADPSQQYAGLAHFLEHMLFLGSGKYPLEGDYNAFLAQNGGASNAFTDLEHTVYFFTVASPALEGALDRFSRFFIDPTLDESAMFREMRAVDSEHRKNLQSDGWRGYQLLKGTASGPLNSFSTGSLDTLNRTGVREALLAFHRLHYHAQAMRLVVVSNQELGTMGRWAADMFSGVQSSSSSSSSNRSEADGRSPSSNCSALTISSGEPAVTAGQGVEPRAAVALAALRAACRTSPMGLWPPEALPISLEVRPVDTLHEFSMMFPLPPVTLQFTPLRFHEEAAACYTEAEAVAEEARAALGVRAASVEFISSLLGGEGEGSALALLKAVGLAERLSVGLGIDAQHFSLLEVTVTLAPGAIQAAQAAADRAAAGAAAAGADAEAVRSATLADAVRNVTHGVAGAIFAYCGVIERALHQCEDSPACRHASAQSLQLDRKPPSPLGRAPVCTTSSSGSKSGSNVLLPAAAAATLAAKQPAYSLWMQRLAARNLSFLFPTKDSDPSALALRLARQMQRVGPLDLLAPPGREVFDPASALRLLSENIVPMNAIFVLTTSALGLRELPLRERVYGTPYASRNVSYETLSALDFEQLSVLREVLISLMGHVRPPNNATTGLEVPLPLPVTLALPPRNPFLPTNLGVRDLGAAVRQLRSSQQPLGGSSGGSGGSLGAPQQLQPVLLLGPADPAPPPASGGVGGAAPSIPAPTLWWLPASSPPLLPKTSVFLELVSPVSVSSPAAAVLTSLWLAAVRDATTAARDQAGATGLGVGVTQGSGPAPSLVLRVEGFSESVAAALPVFARALTGFNVSGDRVSSALSLLLQELRNSVHAQPYSVGLASLDVLTRQRRWSTAQLLAAASAISGSPGSDSPPSGQRSAAAEEGGEGSTAVARPPDALGAAVAAHGVAMLASLTNVTMLVAGNEDAASALLLRQSAHSALIEGATDTGAVSAASAGLLDGTDLMRPIFQSPNEGEHWTHVRALPRNATLLLAQTGPDPVNVNGAAMAVFQLGLVHSCGVKPAGVSVPWGGVQGGRGLAGDGGVDAGTVEDEGGPSYAAGVVSADAGGADAGAGDGSAATREALPSVAAGATPVDDSAFVGGATAPISGHSARDECAGHNSPLINGHTAARAAAAEPLTASQTAAANELAAAYAELAADCTLRSVAARMLLQLIRDPAFDELRTNQQLGYIVTAAERVAPTLLIRRMSGGEEEGSGGAAGSAPRMQPVTTVRLMSGASGVDGDSAAAPQSLSVTTAPVPAAGDLLRSLVVIVQGAVQPADVMTERIAVFLRSFEAAPPPALQLGGEAAYAGPAACAAAWGAAVGGLRASALRLVPRSPGEEADWAWGAIADRSLSFAGRAEEVQRLLLSLRPVHVRALLHFEVASAPPHKALVEVYAEGTPQRRPGADSAAQATSLQPLVGLVA